MSYQNLRGGRVVCPDKGRPEREEWGGSVHILVTARDMETRYVQGVTSLQHLAKLHSDPHLDGFTG